MVLQRLTETHIVFSGRCCAIGGSFLIYFLNYFTFFCIKSCYFGNFVVYLYCTKRITLQH